MNRKNLHSVACVCLILMLAATTAHAQTYLFTNKWGSNGTGDGQFDRPASVALDSSDNLYVADYLNNRIQKFTSDGTFITKWGTSGASDGQFAWPFGVAVDGSDNVYIADYLNHRIQKFTSDGTFITKWGSNGTGDGQFDRPIGLRVDGSNNVYVTDSLNNRIQKFTSDGTYITQWGSLGTGDGQFNSPRGIAVDGSDNVYVIETVNNRIQKFTSDGTFITKWGSNGTSDGQFMWPYDVAVDVSGNVYAADFSNHRIQKFTSDGTFITTWGTNGSGDGQFDGVTGLIVDGSGNVYATDNANSRVQVFAPNLPPTAPTVTILPTAPTTKVSLRATTSGSTDPNGDPISYSYQWYKDGVLQPGRIYRSLGARWTRDGETWRCVVTPSDWELSGPTGEGTETVGSVISAPTVVITPEVPGHSDSLRATASGSTDSDGDPISYTYKWFKDGVEQVGVTWRRLGAWRRWPGQTWRCVVTPTDGTNTGPTGEDSVTLEPNIPPTAPTVVMVPAAPTTADSFKATPSSSPDADGDTITYTYQWYKNGVLKPLVHWPTLGPNRTRAGQTWRCVVTPNDGFDDGPTGEATVLIAANGAPLTVSGLAALPTARGAEVAFTLSADALVTCEVLNIAGRAVKTIVADRPMAEGINSLAWDGSNSAGLRAPAGVYLVRMTATTESGSLSTSMGTLSLTR